MADDEHLDRLVDTLLHELLGGEVPPDLRERIVSRAFPRRSRWRTWGALAAATAALVLAALGVWWLLAHSAARPPTVEQRPPQAPAPYPAARASGRYAIEGRGALARGATLVTEAGAAELVLGGYCHIALAPGTRLRWEGLMRREEVFLFQGQVTCEVETARGGFAVRTEVGTASVAGTRFTVRMTEGDQAMPVPKMWVRVLAGTVLLAGAGGQTVLTAGEEKTEVKSEDPPEERAVGKEGLANAIARGTVIGTVSRKEARWVEITSLSGKTARYIPEWVGGMPADGGGPDRRVLEQIARVRVGEQVRAEWYVDNHLRLLGIHRIGPPAKDEPPEKGAGAKAERLHELPAGTKGTTVGVLAAKERNVIFVRPEGAAEPERFMPRWIGGMPRDGGGLDKVMLGKFEELKVGDRLRVEWVYDERRRAVQIEVLGD